MTGAVVSGVDSVVRLQGGESEEGTTSHPCPRASQGASVAGRSPQAPTGGNRYDTAPTEVGGPPGGAGNYCSCKGRVGHL